MNKLLKKPDVCNQITITMKRLTYISFILLLANLELIAQKQPLYSQFSFNKFLFNPAVAGSDHTTVIKVSAYEQWIGQTGAPKFHTASFDTRIFQQTRKPRRNIRKKFKLFKPGTIGVGAQIFNEKKGPLSNTGLSLTYAYHMKMGRRQLSFGVSPVISNLGLNADKIVLADDVPDLAVLGDKTRRWIMDFDFGVYFLEKDYYLGYSVHHLSNSVIQWGGSTEEDYRINRQHYLMGGYKYVINSDYQLEPGLLFKINEREKSELDLSVKCTIKENYWCGLSYKTHTAVSVFGGVQIDRYFFCYAFDYHLSEIRKFNFGSHELILAVQLGETTHRYRWLNTY